MKRLRIILILALITVPICVLVMRNGNFFEAESVQKKIWILADAFTVPGVVIGGVGVIAWIASKGGMDGIGYGLKNAISVVLPASLFPYESFHDYKTRKNEKHEKSTYFRPMMVYGGTLIAIALVLILIGQIVE